MIDNRFVARVVKNDSRLDTRNPAQDGRVQIFIPVLMEQWKPTDYPWARPSLVGGGGSLTHGASFIPEIGSNVWVWCEKPDAKKNWFYETDVHLAGSHPHQLFQTVTAAAIQSTSQYPNTKFIHFPNGVSIGVDSSPTNPEVFISHPAGSYIKIASTGQISLSAGPTLLEQSVLGETLLQKLNDLIDAINNHTHPSPVGPTGVPVNASVFSSIKAALVQILSPLIKNN